MRTLLLIWVALALSVAPVAQAAMVCCVQLHLAQSSSKDGFGTESAQQQPLHCDEDGVGPSAHASTSTNDAPGENAPSSLASPCTHMGACSMGLVALAHESASRVTDSHALPMTAPAAIGQPLYRTREIDHPPSIS